MNLIHTQYETHYIRVPAFEGPLDLLLSLIEKRKLFINDVALSDVTDDYLKTIEDAPVFPTHNVSGFLLIASTLVLIKSRSLLPELPLTTEEEGDIADLEDRLKRYQLIKTLGDQIAPLYGKNRSYSKKGRKRVPVVFSPDQYTSLTVIVGCIDSLFKNLPNENKTVATQIKQTLRLEDVMNDLRERISQRLRVSFHTLSRTGSHERHRVIVHFIAMLELVKAGSINATQEAMFEDIEMESLEIDTPKYF